MNRNFKKIFSVILALAVTVVSLPLGCFDNFSLSDVFSIKAQASTYEEGILSYIVTDGKAEIIACDTTAEGAVVIPATLGGYPVNRIGDNAFLCCESITGISIPYGVTEIGIGAFLQCLKLETVTIPNSVNKIDVNAFYNCPNLKNLSIPDSVIEIGMDAFSRCNSLVEVAIPDSVVSIGCSAFYWCENLKKVTIGNGLRDIEPRTFEYCEKLETVVLGKNIESIGEYAFFNCSSLSEILLGESLINIGEYAFSYSGLSSIAIPDSVKNIGKGTFSYCESLEDVTFGSGIDKINDNMFTECIKLKEIIVPKNVKTICFASFNGCCALEKLTLSEGLILIEDHTFGDCTSLTELKIPDSVTEIQSWAFSGSGLTEAVLGGGLTDLSFSVFSGCSYLTTITVSEKNENLSSLDGVVFNKDKSEIILYPQAKSQTLYIIPESVAQIRASSFRDCTILQKIIFSENIDKIGEYAFCNCTNLSDISAYNNITQIGKDAFYGTAFYNDLDNRNNGILYLENYIIDFDGSTSGKIEIKEGTKTIADYAFWDCDSITEVVIPDNVENIGEKAFYYCICLADIKMSSNVKNIGAYAFCRTEFYDNFEKKNNAIYLDGCLLYVDNSVSGDYFVSEDITFIADNAFWGCSNIEKVIIPEAVTAISKNAFEGLDEATVYCMPDSYAAEYCAANKINYVVSSYESLKLDTANVKTDYTVGDSLNTDGLSVYAVYSGGVEIPVPLSDVTFSISEFKRAGQFRVTVSYNGKSSYYTVTVSDPVLQSVEIKTMPVKTEYTIGEAIDTEGLVLTVFYSNSTQKEITEGFTVSGKSDEPGEAVITVSYSENGITAQTQYTVTVSEGNNAVVSAESKSVLPGETISVPITISNNSGLMGFAVNIAYDDTVFTPVSVTSGELLSNGMLNDSIGGNVEKGNLKVVFSSTENVTADGLLFTVEVKVDKLATSDVYNFDVSYVESDTFDENWNDVTLICKDFNIEINNSANDLPMFYAESIEGKSGMNVTVPVMLGSGIGLTDFDLILSYDESLLKPLSVSAGEVLCGEIESNCNDASGELVLKWSGEAAESNGVAAYIIFEISEDALGETELTISCADGFEAECSGFLINISKPGTGSSAELYSTTVFVLPGKTVDIPVYISGNTGIMGFGLNVSYDSEKITPLSVKKGDLLSSGMLDNNIGVNDGSYKIIWNHSADIDGDGLLLTLSFEAAENLSVQSIPVTVEYIKADTYNEAWETVELVTNDIVVMVDSLIITPSDAEMFMGETLQLSAAYNYSQESCSVTWTSDNTEIADVDKNGKVTAHSFGTVVITATTDDGLYSASCEINVIPRTLTVEWIVDGKTTIQTVKEGDKITPPDTPEKEGYTFLKWTPEVPDIMAQENLSFTAMWTADTYTVKYNANGGSGSPSEQIKIHGTVLTLSSDKPTRTGYTFIGWNTKADGTGTSYVSGTSYTDNVGTTLYAQWKANTYTVTLDANGGTVSPSSKDVTYESTYGILPTAIRSCYIFNGWYTAKTGGTKVTSSSTVSITANQTLYAQWTEIVLTSIDVKSNPTVVNYYVGDTLDTTGLVLTANYNNNKTETIIEGFVCTPTTLNTAGTQEITVTYGGKTTTFNVSVATVKVTDLEIVTAPNKTSYKVGDKFDPAGLTMNAVNSKGETIVVSEGFVCTPEILDKAGTQIVTVSYGDKSVMITVIVDEVTPKTYTVKFISNGEIISETAYEVGKTIVIPSAPTKDGYKFMGWTPAVPNAMPEYDLTFTAVFEKSYICPECGNEILGEDAISEHIASETKVTISDGVVVTSGELMPNATITVSAPQVDGKIFSHWTVDGATVENSESADTTIVLGSGKITITAEYNDCDCKCHQGGIAGFFFKIVLFFQKLFGNNLECACGAKH